MGPQGAPTSKEDYDLIVLGALFSMSSLLCWAAAPGLLCRAVPCCAVLCPLCCTVLAHVVRADARSAIPAQQQGGCR